MKSKRKEIKKYNVGGYLQAGLGAAQTLYGMSQMPRARAEFERAQAAAPSLETPAQYYENYKNAYDSELARLQNDAIQANLATSVSALQSAGGRALVGGLGAATAGADRQRQAMLAQERALRMQAGQQLAGAQERQIQREEARSQRDIGMASQAYQAALGNVAGGLGSIGTGLLYAGMEDGKKFNLKDAVDKETFIGQELPEVTVTGEAVKTDATGGIDMANVAKQPAEGSMMKTSDEWWNQNVKPAPFNIADYPAPQFPSSKYKPPTQEPQGNLETVVGKMFGGDAVNEQFKYFEGQPQIPADQFDESMLGPDQTYLKVGETVFIRDMSPQQLYERELGRKIRSLGKNFLTGFGMQQTVPFMKEQGGMMTNGDFNHSTNPIDIVQNGIKVGEATGQEVILNPEQARKIANESSYAKKLFKFFAQQAKKNNK